MRDTLCGLDAVILTAVQLSNYGIYAVCGILLWYIQMPPCSKVKMLSSSHQLVQQPPPHHRRCHIPSKAASILPSTRGNVPTHRRGQFPPHLLPTLDNLAASISTCHSPTPPPTTATSRPQPPNTIKPPQL